MVHVHYAVSHPPSSPPAGSPGTGLIQGFQLRLGARHHSPKPTVSSHRHFSPRKSQGTAIKPSKFVGKATPVKRTSSPCQSGRQLRLI